MKNYCINNVFIYNVVLIYILLLSMTVYIDEIMLVLIYV